MLTISLINLVVARFGIAALAGYGIGSRIEFLLIPLVFGLGVSMTSMVGVNMGAGNRTRAEQIGWTGGACAAGLAYAGTRWWGLGLEFVFLCTAAGMLVYGSITAAALKLGDWRR